MAVIALAGCNGAPGVSTTALALLLSWPLPPGRKVLLSECDPDGGAVLFGTLQGTLGDRYGMRNLSVAARKGELPEAFWRQLVDMTSDGGKGGEPRRDRLVLPGVTDPLQSASLAPAWEQFADLFRGIDVHPTHGHDVLIDLGRRGAFGPSAVLAHKADVLVVVARSTMASLHSAKARIDALEEQVGNVGVLLIDEGPYESGEVERVLHVPVLARIPFRPAEAKVLSDGAPAPARFTSGRLMTAAAKATGVLQQRANLRRARLDPRAAHAGGGEVAGAW
ncbi:MULTISPECIES: hypothetical protein [unclassified Streptomyces]|uniref:hypothetical protein n=1 Tax=unclassified Streptomyces TaxID=2593676 RepID=UPI002DDBBC00|nr:hypothetical protein [Streptomyces sp. NBC_01766]WSC24924.1 hypothetical protein OIE60_35235 [Streptomyces sp. NBC_01766]